MPQTASKEELLATAEHLEDVFPPNVPLIRSIYEHALKEFPKDVDVLDQYAVFLLDYDCNPALAETILRLSIRLDKSGFQKYLYLAQLCSGKESLENIEMAISWISKKEKKNPQFRRILSSAHCSIVDLFLTDLCDEENAEVKVKHHVNFALELDPENINAYYSMASYQRIIGDIEKSKENAKKFMDIMRPALLELVETEDETMTENDKEKGNDDDEGLLDDVELSGLPNRMLRKAMARLLVDVESNEDCTLLINSLLVEDPDDLEVHVIRCWNLITEEKSAESKEAIEILEEVLSEVSDLSADLKEEAAKEIQELKLKLKELVGKK